MAIKHLGDSSYLGKGSTDGIGAMWTMMMSEVERDRVKRIWSRGVREELRLVDVASTS